MALNRIVAHHRNERLALRHLTKLGPDWYLQSRRNKLGHPSQRGHTFVFVKRPKAPPPPPPPPKEPVWEWIISFTYEQSGRSFDLIVTASTEAQAFSIARDFLKNDPKGHRIAAANFAGWFSDAARGERTDEEAGEAEYRSDSEQ